MYQQQQEPTYQTRPAYAYDLEAGAGAGTGPSPGFARQAYTPEYGKTTADPRTRIGNLQYDSVWERDVRAGFIRKVYAILVAQLAITFGMAFLFIQVDSIKTYVQQHSGFVILAFVLMIVFICALGCSQSLRRQYPLNLIVLLLFTLVTSYVVGVTTTYYDTVVVMLAVALTTVTVLSLTAFAFQTKTDFTMMSGGICAAIMLLIMFSLLISLFPFPFATVIFSVLAAGIFSFFIIYDTQMLLGDRGKAMALSPDEYVFGALSLYVDVVNLFLTFLSLLGNRRD